jgi:phosphoenolpyruvate carboxykinase (ATP)
MISAILKGELKDIPTETDPIFGLHVPTSVSIEGHQAVPQEILNPRNTWKDKTEYDKKARELAAQFVENFKEYESSVTKEILAAGPNPLASSEQGRSKVQKLRG